MHPAAQPLSRLLEQVTVTRRKAGGPGGQRRNKVETAARVVHQPTGIVAEASERRDFEQNRRVALGRLRMALALGHRESWSGDRPSGLWRRRAAGPRLDVSTGHDDAAALLAEALDALAAHGDDVAAAAEALGVTPARLVKVLKLQPKALSELNRRLQAAGRRTWR